MTWHLALLDIKVFRKVFMQLNIKIWDWCTHIAILRRSCAGSTYPALDGGQQVKYLRETHQRKKVEILSSNWNCPNQYFQIKTIPSSKIERVVGAEFPEPPTSSFLTSSWIGTQVLDIINKYKNRKGENVSQQVEKQNTQKKSHQELSYLKLDLNASIPNIQQIKRKKDEKYKKKVEKYL